MKLFSKARWRAYCKACGWVGKGRRNNLRALEESHYHQCEVMCEGTPVKLKSYDKGIKRTDG